MEGYEDYTTLLTGGAKKSKKSSKVLGGKMTYEDRIKNLEKARAVRKMNLAKKKLVEGSGNYTQDYVDESQVNYAGSPLDMYYLGTEKEERKQKQKRGEIGGGKLSKTDEMKINEILGGKVIKKNMKIKMGGIKKEVEDEMDDIDGGSMKYDIPEAVRVLAELASKFGLKLVK